MLEDIDEKNSEQAKLLAQQEIRRNEIKLDIFTASAFDVTEDGALKVLYADNGKALWDINKKTLVIDRRIGYSELKDKVAEMFGAEVPSPSTMYFLEKRSYAATFRLEDLNLDFVEPDGSVNMNASIQKAGIGFDKTLLCWDGKHMGSYSDRKSWDQKTLAVNLSFSFFSDRFDLAKQAEETYVDVCVASTLPVSKFVERYLADHIKKWFIRTPNYQLLDPDRKEKFEKEPLTVDADDTTCFGLREYLRDGDRVLLSCVCRTLL